MSSNLSNSNVSFSNERIQIGFLPGKKKSRVIMHEIYMTSIRPSLYSTLLQYNTYYAYLRQFDISAANLFTTGLAVQKYENLLSLYSATFKSYKHCLSRLCFFKCFFYSSRCFINFRCGQVLNTWIYLK